MPFMRQLFLLGSLLLALPMWGGNRTVTVAVFTLNDFHCGIVQDLRKEIPGAPWVVQTLDSLKKEYPYHVTLSAGDNFGGSFYYSATRQSSLMPRVFCDMGITLSVPGNHAFDDGQEAFARKWADSDYLPRRWDFRYVCANMRREGRIPDSCQPWAVVPVPIGDGDTVKVAVTGLITANTPYQASARKVAGLEFDARYDAVLDSLEHLPGYSEVAEADVHVLATHITAYNLNGKPVFDDPGQDALYSLDRDDIDAIVAAHSHSKLAGYIQCGRSYPIVQAYWHGGYVGMLLCEVDPDTHRTLKVTPSIVPVNPHARLDVKAARLKAQIDEQIATTHFRGHALNEVLAHAAADIPHDRTVKTIETGVGQLVTEAYADAYRNATAEDGKEHEGDIVVGISHFGSIRAGFYAGDITVLDVGEALPFANPLKCYRYTGRQLKALLDFGLNRCRLGRMQTNRLRVEQDAKGNIRRIYARNNRGEEVPVNDKTRLILVTDDYITTGGDGYSPAFFPEADVIGVDVPQSTDAFIQYLQRKKTL